MEYRVPCSVTEPSKVKPASCHLPQQSSSQTFSTSDTAKQSRPDLPQNDYLRALGSFRETLGNQFHEFARPESVIPYLARFRMALAHASQRDRRPHGLPGKLVVSLTSHPHRFPTLILTLRALLQQTVMADHIILWVTKGEHCLLPKEIRDLQEAGIEIRIVEELRSYKKILPALDAFPDAFICTADDDTYYWPTWLEELVDGYDHRDPTVTCHRAHGLVVDARGQLKPYAQWQRHVRPRGKAMHLFPTGCMGVLYPPGTLAHTADDRAAAFERCPLADDVWLYWIGQRNGTHYKTVGRRRRQISWPGSQRVSLWSYNVNGGNDRQIRNIAEKYGYPPVLEKIAQASFSETLAPTSSVMSEDVIYAWASP